MLQQSRFSPSYTPPIDLISDRNPSGRSIIDLAERSLVPSSFLEQAPRLEILRGKHVSPDALLSSCRALRMIHICPTAPMPKVSAESARSLSGVRCLMLHRSGSIDVETLDIFLSQMPLMHELHLLLLDGETTSHTSGDHILTGRPCSALERYRMHAVLACSIVPLLFCNETLRRLDSTLRGHDDPAARNALINRLGNTAFRRLKTLRLGIRDLQIPESVATRLVAACRFVRALELRVCEVEACDLVDAILRICPRGVQRLTIVSSSLNQRDRKHVETLSHHIDSPARGMPALRELELRRFFRLTDVDLATVRDVCRKRRINFRCL